MRCSSEKRTQDSGLRTESPPFSLGGRTESSVLSPRYSSLLLRRLHNDSNVLGAVLPGHVQELDRRLVVVLGRALEKDHLGRIAVHDVPDLLGELIGGHLILVDEDARFRHT